MPLTAPAVSELDVEGTSLALWQEFLAGYFDGASHIVGSNPTAVFPKAALRFGQSAAPQPAGSAVVDVVISLVWLGNVGPRRLEWEKVGNSTQQMAYSRTAWLFYVRASVNAATPGPTAGNPQKLCTLAAGRLQALLGNSDAALPLAQKGVAHLRPDEPRPIEDKEYIVRTLRCRGWLRYPVLSQ